MSGSDEGIASRIDHALLRPDANASDVDRHCREALEHGFAAVCVHGLWVARCSGILAGSPVRVASVVGFPHGGMEPAAKRFEARHAIEQGAREIDMVIALGALKSGEHELVRRDIGGIAGVCRDAGALLKVILETGMLSHEEKVLVCGIAVEARADFVKTSTGFSASGATPDDVALLRRLVPPSMGVKASGGIRDARTARAMIRAGATRIGTSSSIAIVRGT
jgi:deoxyribose-phosphate aldolase